MTHEAQPDGSSYTRGFRRCEVSAISSLLQMSGVDCSWTRYRAGRRAGARPPGRDRSIAPPSAEGHHPKCMSDRRSHGDRSSHDLALDSVVRVLGDGAALGTRPTHRRVPVRDRRHRGRARHAGFSEYWAGGAGNGPNGRATAISTTPTRCSRRSPGNPEHTAPRCGALRLPHSSGLEVAAAVTQCTSSAATWASPLHREGRGGKVL